jgi:hypothetical protein
LWITSWSCELARGAQMVPSASPTSCKNSWHNACPLQAHAPASITLQVIGTHKPPLHDKAVINLIEYHHHHHHWTNDPFGATTFLTRACQISSSFHFFVFHNSLSARCPTPNMQDLVSVLTSLSDPAIPLDSSFRFHCLLQLAGILWRYSNLPPYHETNLTYLTFQTSVVTIHTISFNTLNSGFPPQSVFVWSVWFSQ